MDLICVNCGALLAESYNACTACGTSREASLPPGSASVGSATAILKAAPVVVPQQRMAPPAPAHGDPRAAYQQAPAYAVAPDQSSTGRPRIGAVDITLTLVSVALAFGLGWLVHGDVDSIQSWMVLRSVFGIDLPSTFSGHDVLVMLVTFSPLALAALVAPISRVPATGTLVAAAGFAAVAINGNGPRVLGLSPEFDLARDWVIVVALAGFVVADLILVFSERGTLAGLLTGAFTGVITAGFTTLYIQRINDLAIFDEAWLVVLILVVPTLFLLVAGLLGGALGGLRRR